MNRMAWLGAAAAVLLAAVVLVLLWRRTSESGLRQDASVVNATASILPKGPASDWFASQPLGDPIRGNERPLISNVQIVDLDKDGLPDVLVCDTVRNRVDWIRQFPKGVWTESPIGDAIAAPAHAEAVDFDHDGDLDVVVAGLGVVFPNNNRIGSVVVLENDGRGHFINHTVVERVARVADARAADLDGDGDLDITVAGFGYDQGETAWLENKGGWKFEYHVLQRLSGPINALVTDLDGNGTPDILALVSQDWEEIWGFLNDGRGHFTPSLVWGSTNPDFGSSWITVADMDRDGDPDILYSNGDALDYAPTNSRPWHGIQWLENTSNMRFVFHRIAALSGASSPQAVDLDGDGDIDVVVSSAYNRWERPDARSLVWLENNGRMQFAMHDIAASPTHIITVAAGDLDGDGRIDLVTGGLHISRPYDRMGRVTLWTNRSGPAAK